AKLRRVQVCSVTGLRPCAASPATVGELFLPGTEPREKADAWFSPDGHALLPAEYAGWCGTGDNYLGATVRQDGASLAILTPREGAVFNLDGSIPQSQQQLELQASDANGVAWSINGERIAPDGEGRVLWQLKAGDWTLEASNGTQKVVARFSVQGD
ncbi:MAG: hypothetical protein WCD79_13545, partial [Chthoniobacteraceae bacterium]